MKFAQYLRDTQTPEWKKAYIDYRGIKKRITAIRNSQQGTSFHVTTYDHSSDEIQSLPNGPRPSDAGSEDFRPTDDLGLQHLSSHLREGERDGQSRVGRTQTVAVGKGEKATSFKATRDKNYGSMMGSDGASQRQRRIWQANPLAALPLHELLEHLSPQEVSFFTMLDAQLDKVESFYLAREKEMLARGHALKMQLDELQGHRQLFLRARPRESWGMTLLSTFREVIGLYPAARIPSKHDFAAQGSPSPERRSTDYVSKSPNYSVPSFKAKGKRRRSDDATGQSSDEDKMTEESPDIHSISLSADPDSYLYAKRKLKKAVIEHYRGLEMLHNYRILNITGFRKALKKFEKVTKIPSQQQYMTEKVETSAFASDLAVREMMKDMEDLYSTSFVRGNKKKAMKRLRVGSNFKNHHFSTFRSGILLGAALPPFIDGMIKVFQPRTREALPQWGALLYVYGILLVPTLYALLVGLNLLVWANARINYVFIFELDVLTQIDHRAYFETPAVLLATLSYAFWLSFSLVGPPGFSPTLWPLFWLAFTVIVILNPLPIFFRSSRYWLVKHIAGLFMSGTKRVEFTDFWMGDQFCSLVFTLSNLYFVGCVYVDEFSPNWNKCNISSKHWPLAFLGAALPLLIRLIQSIKRYADSKLVTHLINGGKYGTGIIAYLFLFMWRHHQINHGAIFALYILTGICYSMYALTWDLLMDWSVLRIHSTYPLLRPELVYSNNITMYYSAIVTNILIRFIWIIYIPKSGPSMMLRSFVAGILEMLRRIQWNFYRLENEHLGNVDQYRVTREVPLPYNLDSNREYDKDDDDDSDDRQFQSKR